MNTEATRLVSESLKVIESSRYEMGVMPFLTLFVDHWAYYQSGIHPPKEDFPQSLSVTGVELSRLLGSAMKADPTSDILGYVLSQAGFHQKGTNFYPTPPEVAKLMAGIISSDKPLDPERYYEPCCGTGINTIAWVENYIEENGKEALGRIQLFLEDIDQTMVKACFLQLMNYFASRDIAPKVLSVRTVDTLSRKGNDVDYYLESSEHRKERIANLMASAANMSRGAEVALEA